PAREAPAPSLRGAFVITNENPWRIFTVTILMSILGSKALGFFVFLFQQAAQPGAEKESLKSAFTITEMVKNLGWVALTVIVILLIMSMYSIAIMVERFLTYSAAKKQSREFAPRVAQALKNDRIEEAINISDKHKKSHLAMVVNARCDFLCLSLMLMASS